MYDFEPAMIDLAESLDASYNARFRGSSPRWTYKTTCWARRVSYGRWGAGGQGIMRMIAFSAFGAPGAAGIFSSGAATWLALLPNYRTVRPRVHQYQPYVQLDCVAWTATGAGTGRDNRGGAHHLRRRTRR
jgi:hypothetical protein